MTHQNWEAIRAWKDIANCPKRLPEEFCRLIALWEAFNCWTRGRYPDVRDAAAVRKVAAEEIAIRCFEDLSGEPKYSTRLKNLRRLGPVREVIGGLTSDRAPREIKNAGNLLEVLEFIYFVRCNLFHGGKRPEAPRDRCLAQAAYDVLDPLFEKLLDETVKGWS